MQRLYLDAMAVVARHGKPDLFITFTCNPNWPEIKENLEYLQKPENRPDLVCRVFHAKLLEFLDDIIQKQIFGIVLNYHYVIEFQKRGLPHAHIVVTFIADNRILNPDQVDEIISTRIPDRELQPRLYDLVAKYQVHRPCGAMNPNASCMDGGRCKKFFPKPYADRTVLGAANDKRPIYKRPRDHRFIQFPTCTITNSRIVPYNPYSLAKYHTHINFEVVGSLDTLKYLYKYVTKGQDCVTIFEHENGDDADGAEGAGARFEIDEVRNYLDCRYVSSTEAAWRLLEFKLNGRSHSVLVLPVHLPGENYVVFEEDDEPEELEERLARRSKLEAWFLLNTEDADARQYSYVEIPEHYVWDNRGVRWRARQQVSKLIGCLAEVTPRGDNLELFYLRVLLRHVRGATSFEALRTVDGVVHESFEEACDDLDLLRHTDEYDLCLNEASLIRHPRQLRRLFALIICVLNNENFGQVPLLWRKYREKMIEDYLHRGNNRRDSLTLCIREIDAILSRNRPDLRCDRLGIVIDVPAAADDDIDEEANEVAAAAAEANAEPVDFGQFHYTPRSLNSEQKRIFLRVLQSVSRATGKLLPVDLYEDLLDDDAVTVEEVTNVRAAEDNLFFVDGPGGTGKTFLYNTLITYASQVLNVPVIAVAWTGIAANLLVGGTTVHRAFRLPLTLNETTTVGWHVESETAQFHNGVGLILWDESPMTHRYAVEAVDRYLRDITGVRDKAMGGKCCVFGGDFRQVLPVVPLGHRASVIDASLKRLPFWQRFAQLKLTTNIRAGNVFPDEDRGPLAELDNRTFSEWLLALGEGRLPYVRFEHLKSVPPDLIEIPSIFNSPSLEALISYVYSEDFMSEDVGAKAILSPTNAMVENVNGIILDLLPGESRTYVSVDECKHHAEDEIEIPQDVLNSINVAGLPPHNLTLKEGAVVMLLRNLDVERGECNGTRMKVTELGEHVIECELISGENRGRAVLLPKIDMIARDSMVPQEVIRTQFPVRLAYAMTINKAQGQTLQKVGVYLQRSCFTHGQLYVAFSRVGNPRNIRVYVEEGLKQGSLKTRRGKKFTRNVVFHTVLSDDVPPRSEEENRYRVIPGGEDDVAGQASLEEMFGADRYDTLFERINVSQIIRRRNAEESAAAATAAAAPTAAADAATTAAPDVEPAENRRSIRDPFVDPAGIDIRCEFPPPRTRAELMARVSMADRPGTSGLRVPPRKPPPPPRYSDSDSYSD